MGQYGRVTPEFVRMKGKMTLALIETVMAYLDKDHEKLGKVPISVLANVVRWVDKLVGTFTMLEPNMAPIWPEWQLYQCSQLAP